MTWLSLAILDSFIVAALNIASKKVSQNSKLDEYSVGWLRTLASLPLVWVILFLSGFPVVDVKFWLLCLLMVPIELLMTLIYFKSIKISAVSLVTPITSSVPLFSALSAYLVLSEKLYASHVIALILLVIGLFLLNTNYKSYKDLFRPFKKIATEKGVVLMFLACMLAGLNTPIQKLAMQYSSAQFFAAIFFSLSAVTLSFVYYYKSKSTLKDIFKSSKEIVLMGALFSLHLITITLAYSKGQVVGVSIVSSLNILITILLAGKFFKEKDLIKKLIAGIIMITGAAIIIINS